MINDDKGDHRTPEARRIEVEETRLGYRIHLRDVWGEAALVNHDEARALHDALGAALRTDNPVLECRCARWNDVVAAAVALVDSGGGGQWLQRAVVEMRSKAPDDGWQGGTIHDALRLVREIVREHRVFGELVAKHHLGSSAEPTHVPLHAPSVIHIRRLGALSPATPTEAADPSADLWQRVIPRDTGEPVQGCEAWRKLGVARGALESVRQAVELDYPFNEDAVLQELTEALNETAMLHPCPETAEADETRRWLAERDTVLRTLAKTAAEAGALQVRLVALRSDVEGIARSEDCGWRVYTGMAKNALADDDKRATPEKDEER